MPYRIAFTGFRHGHIFDLYNRARQREDYEITAACEEDAAAREQLLADGKAEITHSSYQDMLDAVDADVVAVGDYFGKRGQIIIQALERGKHVISDKPICTSLEQLDRIESLAGEKGLVIGCMLDLRDAGCFRGLRDIVLGGTIGEVHAVHVGGQHPLLLGTRPAWYFEEGKHGGTINDIGIHAFDIIPWITGLQFREVVAARSWNAFAGEFPHFHDAGQFMLRMDNGCGVMGDVSYFMPDSSGYKLDLYWRMTVFGTKGIAETSYNMNGIRLALNGKDGFEILPPADPTPGGYLDSFTREISGEKEGLSPSSADALRASRIALTVQKVGSEGSAFVPIS